MNLPEGINVQNRILCDYLVAELQDKEEEEESREVERAVDWNNVI